MRLRNTLLALVVIALATTGTAEAKRRRFSSGGNSDYVSNGKFGLGLELGGPSGLNGKYFLTDSTALNFGIGWIDDHYYYDNGRDGLHLYIDHLWHPVLLASTEPFLLPFYVGVGVRVWDFDDRDNRFDDDGTAIGVRAPLGIAFDFNNVPLDIFVQFAFVLDFFVNDYRDDRLGLHLEGSVGIRYWFD
ncbi:MAG TPA: hypothetical protein VFQ53_11735 [Kofleriaceae bacterium]|nr:hypothetical protein [Kofleriaceae bacterium]